MASPINRDLSLAKTSLRDQFGTSLVELGQERPEVVVLDADLSSSTSTHCFAKAFPNRFFNVGIAEQNMMGIAMGFALAGKVPVVSGFSCFTTGRAWDFIRMAAYDHLALKICTTHAGLSAGKDGGSHQALEDLALLCAIPGTNVFAPCDPRECDQMLRYLLSTKGVSYLRMMRNALPWVWDQEYHFKFGHADLLYQTGTEEDSDVDVTFCSTGSMTCFLPPVLSALETQGYRVRAWHFGTIKPLDQIQIQQTAMHTRLIVTLEEHNSCIGFGVQVARIVGESCPRPLLVLGIADEFGQSGTSDELYRAYGLKPPQIVETVQARLRSLSSS